MSVIGTTRAPQHGSIINENVQTVASSGSGRNTAGKTWKVHMDGYNFLPYFKVEVKASPRGQILYFG